MDDLYFPDPWFKSFGFAVVVEEFDSNKTSKKVVNNIIKPDMYCRILLAFDPKERLKFIMENITEKYHFILNSGYKQTNKIEKIYAFLSKDDKFYKISFKEFKIIKSNVQDVIDKQNMSN